MAVNAGEKAVFFENYENSTRKRYYRPHPGQICFCFLEKMHTIKKDYYNFWYRLGVNSLPLKTM